MPYTGHIALPYRSVRIKKNKKNKTQYYLHKKKEAIEFQKVIKFQN